jgi:arabinan endo-1,5-alpha-L-arabinosidase
MLLPALVSLASLFASALAVGPGIVTGSTDVHDPTICKDNNGKYFLFSTAPGIAIRTSTDRTAWTYSGVMWPNGGATWTNEYTGSSHTTVGLELS